MWLNFQDLAKQVGAVFDDERDKLKNKRQNCAYSGVRFGENILVGENGR